MKNENTEKLNQVAKIIGMKVNSERLYDHGGGMEAGALSLFVRYSPYGHKNKWSISASVDRSNKVYLSDKDKEELTLSINVSEEKSAEQIAKDIEKRLMPSAKKYFELVSEKLASNDEYEKALQNNCKRIAKITGGKVPELGQSSNMGFSVRDSVNELTIYGTVQVMRDSCYVEARNCTIEQAEQILKILGVNRD